MNNAAYSLHKSKKGIYNVHKIVNGKMSWKSTKAEGRNQAIWFDSKSDNWGIGALEKIGSNNFQIKAEAKCGENHPCDLANNCWLYLKSNGHEWKDPRGSTDIEFRKLHEGKNIFFLKDLTISSSTNF